MRDVSAMFIVLLLFHRVIDPLVRTVVIEVISQSNIPAKRIHQHFFFHLLCLVPQEPIFHMSSSFSSQRSLIACNLSSNYAPEELSTRPHFWLSTSPKMSPINSCLLSAVMPRLVSLLLTLSMICFLQSTHEEAGNRSFIPS